MASEDTIADVEAECFCDSEAEILECGDPVSSGWTMHEYHDHGGHIMVDINSDIGHQNNSPVDR